MDLDVLGRDEDGGLADEALGHRGGVLTSRIVDVGRPRRVVRARRVTARAGAACRPPCGGSPGTTRSAGRTARAPSRTRPRARARRRTTPTSSAASITAASSTTRRQIAVWSPAGPTGSHGVSTSSSRAALRVGSSVGTATASGDCSRNEPSPSSVRAATITQSADATVEHERLHAVEDPVRALAAGTCAHPVDRVAVALLLERDGAAQRARRERPQQVGRLEAARREGREHGRRVVRTGERETAHLLHHHVHVDEPEAEAAVLLGHQQAGPPDVGDLLPDLVGEAALVVGHGPHVGPGRLALEELADAGSERVLIVGEREVQFLARSLRAGLPGPRTLSRWASASAPASAPLRGPETRPEKPDTHTTPRTVQRIDESPTARIRGR